MTNHGEFNELIHTPIRLRICASLAPLNYVEFGQLRESLGIADSALSKHLKQLSDAEFIDVEKFSKGGRSRVRIMLNSKGRHAYVRHVAALRALTEGSL